jgi:hypothetical protein
MPNRGVFACSRPGTEGSNSPPSSGESSAKPDFLTFVHAEWTTLHELSFFDAAYADRT